MQEHSLRTLVLTEWKPGFRWHVPQLPAGKARGPIDVVSIPIQKWPRDFFRTAEHLHRIVKLLPNYDVLIVRGNVVSTFLLVALRYLRVIQVPFLAIAEFGTSERRHSVRSILKYSGYQRILRAADLVFPFTEIEADYYSREFRIDREKFIAVRQAVNYFALDQYPKVSASHDGNILTVGRTDRDYATLAKAVRGLDAHIDVVASRESVRDIDFPENVRLHCGVKGDEMYRMFDRAKYFLLPLAETWHVVGLRSLFYVMERGKACIVSRTRSIMEYFPDDSVLRLYPPGDVGALREAIEDFERHPNKMQEAGTKCRHFVEKHFTSQEHIEKVYECISKHYHKKLGRTGLSR